MTFTPDDVDRLRTAVGRIWRRLEAEADSGGLTRTGLSVLGAVRRARTVAAGELSEREHLNPTMLSRVVGKLELAGLVRRTADPDDRRVVQIAITPAGTRLHDRMRRERSAAITRHLDTLTPEDVDALADALPALEALATAMIGRQPVAR